MANFLYKRSSLLLLASVLVATATLPCHAGDVDVQLTSTDGSTKFTFQNSSSVEIASVTSQGDAYFRTVQPVQSINMGFHPINNLAEPTATSDAVTKNYVDNATSSVNTSSLI